MTCCEPKTLMHNMHLHDTVPCSTHVHSRALPDMAYCLLLPAANNNHLKDQTHSCKGMRVLKRQPHSTLLCTRLKTAASKRQGAALTHNPKPPAPAAAPPPPHTCLHYCETPPPPPPHAKTPAPMQQHTRWRTPTTASHPTTQRTHHITPAAAHSCLLACSSRRQLTSRHQTCQVHRHPAHPLPPYPHPGPHPYPHPCPHPYPHPCHERRRSRRPCCPRPCCL